MKTIFTILIIFTLVPCLAQRSNLIVFSDKGERFTLILNGLKYNDKPETNVKAENLEHYRYNLKIIFANPNLPEISKIVYLTESSTEYVYEIFFKKGKYKIREQSRAYIGEVSTAAPPIYNVPSQQPPISSVPMNDPNQGKSVSVGINVKGVGVNVSMNEGSSTPPPPAPVYTPVYVHPGYDGPYGCPMPMPEQEFRSAKESIRKYTFDREKLSVAKQMIDYHCFHTGQIQDLMSMFDFDDNKLEIAKYAYLNTLDRGNYFKLNEAFTFDSSIEKLQKYISSVR